MEIRNPSPGLYNEDLAPAKERHWGAFSIFNVWTSDVHSLWGYYLAASLFLLCGSFINFVLAIGLGSLVIFALMNLIGYAGEKTGVPYPVLARASFGVWGANLRGAGARRRRLLLVRRADGGGVGRDRRAADPQRQPDGVPQEHALPRPLGAGGDLLRGHLGAAAAHHPERHGDGAQVPGLGRPGGVGRDADPGDRPVREGRRLLVRPRHSDGRAAREDQGRRRQRRAGLVLGADGGGRDLDHLLRGAVPELLRLLALREEPATP